MKQTDLDRREREIRRARKKEERLAKDGVNTSELSVGDYINNLKDLFFHDETKIYNQQETIEFMEFFEDMKLNLPEKQWETVVRKAIKKTGVKEKEPAVKFFIKLMEEV